MKKLLLTSAIVAVSGAAFAEITWSGDAGLYWNTHQIEDATSDFDVNKDGKIAADGTETFKTSDYRFEQNGKTGNQHGLRFEASITPTATAELDSGIKATLKYDLDIAYANNGAKKNDNANGTGITVEEGFPTLILESSAGTFTVGEVDHAAHGLFKSVSMSAVEFTEEADELNARVDTKYSGVTVGVNYVVAQGNKDFVEETPITAASAKGMHTGSYTAGAAGTFGQFTVSAGYQLDSGLMYNKDGVQVNAKNTPTTLATEVATHGESVNWNQNGVDVTVAYISKQVEDGETTTSIGLGAKYTMQNGVNLAGYVNSNSSDMYSLAAADSTTGAANATEAQWMSYKVQAGFKAMGADITLGYKDKIVGWSADNATSAKEDGMNDPENADGTQGVFLDATYEVAPGAVLMAGYDGTDKIQAYKDYADFKGTSADSLYGSYYVGGSYALGGGAKVYLTHSNAVENDVAESVKAGTTLGLSLAF